MKVSNLIIGFLVIVSIGLGIAYKVTIDHKNREISNLQTEKQKQREQFYIKEGERRATNARERMGYLHRIDSLNIHSQSITRSLVRTEKELKLIKGRYSNRTESELGNLMDSIANDK